MGRDLPAWAAKIEPLDMDRAAVVLGISRRTLVDVIKQRPHYERRGVKKVFYPEHIDALREGLNQWRGSKSNSEAGSTTPLGPLPETAYEKALALVQRSKPKNSARSSKRGSGNVIPMETKRSEPSRRPL